MEDSNFIIDLLKAIIKAGTKKEKENDNGEGKDFF